MKKALEVFLPGEYNVLKNNPLEMVRGYLEDGELMKDVVDILKSLIEEGRDSAEVYNKAAGTSTSPEEAFETLKAIEDLTSADRVLLEAASASALEERRKYKPTIERREHWE